MKKRELIQPQNTLQSTLFGLATLKPNNTEKVTYINLGPYLMKKKFYQFIDEVKRSMGITLDTIVYSRIAIEVSKIDGNDHIEISLDKRCSLPIAGNQYRLLEHEANKFELSLNGFVDSLNFILNDSRIYKK